MGTILYIDDDEQYRQVINTLLVSRGFAIETAQDGLEGVRKARELQPDLILLDLCLSRMDGLDVIKQLKGCSRTWDIPVIFLSIFPADSSCLLVQQIGAQGFVPKPLQAKKLVEIIRRLLPSHRRRFSDPIVHWTFNSSCLSVVPQS